MNERMSEEQLSRLVVKLAQRHGWLVAHFHNIMVRPGKAITPVGANGAGFPDLVLVRERVVYAELKREGRRALRDEQKRWREHLIAAGQEHYIWNPVDWRQGTIEAILKERDPRRWERLLDSARGDRRHAAEVHRLVES